MKNIIFSVCFILLSISLNGCNQKDEQAETVVIQPGQFFSTEPSAIKGSLSKAEKCSLDSINGQLRKPKIGWDIRRGEQIEIQGWAFSDDGKKASPEIYVQLIGVVESYFAVTTTRTMRSDANQYLRIDPSLAGGFQLQAKTDAIEPGVYKIEVVQRFGDRIETCEDGVNLTVK
ncbi:MAG: hypothetical protein QM709_01760 [Spongiibacteraceae bacterium]